MQTWAKRGIQTALMTGGMLALGAGIAAAAENCELRPCSPLDGGVRIPINVDNNAVGTPVGQKDLPSVHREIGTDQIAARILQLVVPPGGPDSGVVPPGGPDSGVVPPGGPDSAQDPFRGNRGSANVVAPVDVSGNAIALGGNAETHNASHQEAAYNEPIHTDGGGGTLAGNVLVLALALPIQLDGNAIALLGNARSYNSSSQRATAGSGVTTSGDGGTLSGNVLAGQFAVPVQGTGNAIALVGNSDSQSTSESGAYAPGALSSSGDRATGSGNVLGVPVGVPVGVNGNAVSVVGNSRAESETAARAIAGSTVPGRFGGPAYVRTSGNDSTLSGNGGELPVSGPVEVDGNALAAVGNAVSRGSSCKYTRAGGGVSTGGTESTVSGSVLEGPVAPPTQVFGNAGSVIGNADAQHCNATHSTAGGDTFTNGDRSVLSGDGAVVPPATATDVFGNGVSVIGNSSGHGANTTDVSTGGYTGTTGNDAVGSGNVVTTPVAVPVECFGLAGSALGNATGEAEETKKIHSGNGDTNTDDDGGTLSSNVVGVAIAAPVQVFGDAASVIANAHGTGWNDTTATAGRNTRARGTTGTGSGNIGYVPVSLPTQVFGDAGTVLGNGDATAFNDTHSKAGGDARTDGVGGSASGNVASVPVAGAAQAFGNALSVLGIADGSAENATTSVAGGDIRTSGEDGSLAGNILQVPITVEALVFGNAATVGGIARGVGVNDLRSQAGGSTTTSGAYNALSGTVAGEPVRVLAKTYNVPVEIVGHAMAEGRDRGDAVGQDEPDYLDVPTVGERLGAADIP